MIDRNQVINVEAAKAVLKSLAHFHGAWLVWLSQDEPNLIGGTTKEQFLNTFAFDMNPKEVGDCFKIKK